MKEAAMLDMLEELNVARDVPMFPERVDTTKYERHQASQVRWHVFTLAPTAQADHEAAECGVRFSEVEFPRRLPARATSVCGECRARVGTTTDGYLAVLNIVLAEPRR